MFGCSSALRLFVVVLVCFIWVVCLVCLVWGWWLVLLGIFVAVVFVVDIDCR